MYSFYGKYWEYKEKIKLNKQRKSLTCVYEHMSAQVVGAAEGSVTVLTDMWFWAGGHAGPICIQHHGLQEENHEYMFFLSADIHQSKNTYVSTVVKEMRRTVIYLCSIAAFPSCFASLPVPIAPPTSSTWGLFWLFTWSSRHLRTNNRVSEKLSINSK